MKMSKFVLGRVAMAIKRDYENFNLYLTAENEDDTSQSSHVSYNSFIAVR